MSLQGYMLRAYTAWLERQRSQQTPGTLGAPVLGADPADAAPGGSYSAPSLPEATAPLPQAGPEPLAALSEGATGGFAHNAPVTSVSRAGGDGLDLAPSESALSETEGLGAVRLPSSFLPSVSESAEPLALFGDEEAA